MSILAGSPVDLHSASTIGGASFRTTANFVAGTDYLAPNGSGAALTGFTSTQITNALGYTPINKAGDTGIGALVFTSSVLGGQGAGNRYISGGGTTTNFYLNAATGGQINLAVGEVSQVDITASGASFNTDIFAGAATTYQKTYLAGGSGVLHFKDLAYYNNSIANVSGIVKIKLPAVGNNGSNTMMTMRVTGFNYAGQGGGWDMVIGGYNYTGGWANCSAKASGYTPVDSVSFCQNGSGERYVLLVPAVSTNAWQYPKVVLSDLLTGHGGANSAWDGFTMGLLTNVLVATTAALGANNATATTLTSTTNLAFPAVDGVTLALNDRILVKNEVAGANNGIYYLSQVGSGALPWILTRATDADTWAELYLLGANVTSGTTNANTYWDCTNTSAGTLGTTAVTYTQLTQQTAQLADPLTAPNSTYGRWKDTTGTPRRLVGMNQSNQTFLGPVDASWGAETYVRAGTSLIFQTNGASGTFATALTLAANQAATFAATVLANQGIYSGTTASQPGSFTAYDGTATGYALYLGALTTPAARSWMLQGSSSTADHTLAIQNQGTGNFHVTMTKGNLTLSNGYVSALGNNTFSINDATTGAFGAAEPLRIRNLNGTNNTWTNLGFYGTGSVAAGVAAQVYDQVNSYATLGFYTRNATNWGLRLAFNNTGDTEVYGKLVLFNNNNAIYGKHTNTTLYPMLSASPDANSFTQLWAIDDAAGIRFVSRNGAASWGTLTGTAFTYFGLINQTVAGRIDNVLKDTTAAVDAKQWDISLNGAMGANTLAIGIRNDAGTWGAAAISWTRSGNTLSSMTTGAPQSYLGAVTAGQSSTGYPVVGYGVTLTGTNGVYNYRYTDIASAIDFGNGAKAMRFLVAASGTAGNPITFVNAMDFTTTAINLNLATTFNSGATFTNTTSFTGTAVFTQIPNFFSSVSTNPENGPWNPLWSALAAGRPLYFDEEFATGNNSVVVYNNAGGSAVTITREADASAPNRTGYRLKVYYDGVTAPAPSPGLGGFQLPITAAANRTYVQRFRAKLPVGFSFALAENSQGTNKDSYWLTPVAGTGKWEEYIRVSHCGNTGTFSSGGHVYITGTGTYTCYLASCNIYEIDTSGIADWYQNGGSVLSPVSIVNNTLGSQLKLQNAAATDIQSHMSQGGASYLGTGIYYNGSAWTHLNSVNGSNQLLKFTLGTGVQWYASNNSAASFNVANGVNLWNEAGTWVGAAALTGTPTAPTATPGTNTTQIATCAFVFANALANPMTTANDMIYGGVSGAATRLPAGGAGTVLTSVAGVPTWSSTIGSNLTIGATQAGGRNANTVVRGQFNNLIWGHNNNSYLAVLGAQSGNGYPFLGFYCYHSTTANTFARASGTLAPTRLEVDTNGTLTYWTAPVGTVDADITNWSSVLSVSLAGLLSANNISIPQTGVLSFGSGSSAGVRFTYGSLCEVYSSQATVVGHNIYVNPADTVAGQLRSKQTHATTGHTFHQMAGGQHKFYGASGATTADAILAPTLQATLDSSGFTLAVGAFSGSGASLTNLPSSALTFSGLTAGQVWIAQTATTTAWVTVSGDVTISASGTVSIGANKVTNGMLAQMTANTLKGNNTGSAANAADLTVTQVKTMLVLKTPMRWFYENALATTDKQPAYRVDAASTLKACRTQSQTPGTGTILIKINGTTSQTLTMSGTDSATAWVDKVTSLSVALAAGDSVTAVVSASGTAAAVTVQLDIEQTGV